MAPPWPWRNGDDWRPPFFQTPKYWEVDFWMGTAVGAATVAVVAGGLAVRQRSRLGALRLACKRAEADAETARRVAQRDVDQARQFAAQKLAKDMLQVADSLKLALVSISEARRDADRVAKASKDYDDLAEGYAVLDKQLDTAFASSGITPFGAVGDEFDPSRHQAIDGGGSRVARVHALGYELHGRVVRAAAVTVGTATDAPPTHTERDERTNDASPPPSSAPPSPS
mmetsp:Transcript_36556/g.117228  ORF Transcript_36556/g.117228 Transcript_36556/m.117228 type:complete len:228 (+) Transcript_36556:45-728(+)